MRVVQNILTRLGALSRHTSLYALALSLILVAVAVIVATGQPGPANPTRVPAGQLLVDFDPAYFVLSKDALTGRTTVRLIRPIPEAPARPPEPVVLTCTESTCPLPVSGAEVRDVDLYRNGIKMTQGRDYDLSVTAPPAVTLTGGGPAEAWEIITARVYYQ